MITIGAWTFRDMQLSIDSSVDVPLLFRTEQLKLKISIRFNQVEDSVRMTMHDTIKVMELIKNELYR